MDDVQDIRALPASLEPVSGQRLEKLVVDVGLLELASLVRAQFLHTPLELLVPILHFLERVLKCLYSLILRLRRVLLQSIPHPCDSLLSQRFRFGVDSLLKLAL